MTYIKSGTNNNNNNWHTLKPYVTQTFINSTAQTANK